MAFNAAGAILSRRASLQFACKSQVPIDLFISFKLMESPRTQKAPGAQYLQYLSGLQ